MPELPELQALAERLDELLAGASLAGFVPLQFSAVKTFEPAPEALVRRALAQVTRRGKYLVFDFQGPRLLVHLSQGGRVKLEDPPKRTRPKEGVLRLVFEGRPALLIIEYGSHRKAGCWVLAEGDDGPLARLGPEPLSAKFEEWVLAEPDRRHLHSILRDQRTVAGIGRGYADDILHRARLSPFASLDRLSSAQRSALVDALASVLDEALAVERRRTGGLPAQLGDRFTVHGRFGHPCPRCGDDLRRVSYEDYEVTYCPACQTGGRVLADRRLSRLVR